MLGFRRTGASRRLPGDRALSVDDFLLGFGSPLVAYVSWEFLRALSCACLSRWVSRSSIPNVLRDHAQGSEGTAAGVRPPGRGAAARAILVDRRAFRRRRVPLRVLGLRW